MADSRHFPVLRAEGFDARDDDVARLLPPGHEHINAPATPSPCPGWWQW
jgi:hypothetical protein